MLSLIWGLKGKSFKYWININKNRESKLYGFDSFYGLSVDLKQGLLLKSKFSQNTFSTDGKIPNINNTRVNFIKGLFQNTSPQFLNDFKLSKN